MILLIDGYNVLKHVHGVHVSEQQRSAFVNLMGRYIQKRTHNKVLIFFDAGPCTYPLQQKQKGVPVIFSGEYKSADDMIMEYITEHKQKELLVVTYDREIKTYAARYAIETLEPEVFYTTIKNILTSTACKPKKQDHTLRKLIDEENPELDTLMELYSAAIPQDSYHHEYQEERVRAHALKKKEKRKKNMWEKL